MNNGNIDIKALSGQLFIDFKGAVLTAVAEGAPAIVGAATAYITQAEERLIKLAEGAISGELPYDFVVRRLKEEEITLEAALIGIEQMLASDIQALISKIISIFEGLLKQLIVSIGV